MTTTRRMSRPAGIRLIALGAVIMMVLVSITAALAEEAPPIAWTHQFGALRPASEFASAVDAQGNVYVAGSTNGTFEGQTNSGGYADAFVRKYDADGNTIWTRQFGTIQYDYASGVYSDASGVYVAGRTDASLPGQTGSGGADGFLRMYDHDGNEVWTLQFGTSQDEYIYSMSGSGTALYVSGQTRIGNEHHALLYKFDTSGTPLWSTSFAAGWGGDISDLFADSTGVYAVGRSTTLPGQTTSGSYIRRYNSDGTEAWTNQFGGAFAAGVASDGTAVYVADVVVLGLNRARIGKFSPVDGSNIWFQVLEATPSGGHSSSDIAVRTTGTETAVYLAAWTFGMVFPGETSPDPYMTDAFVRRYDADGNVNWTQQFGVAAHEAAAGVSVDASGVYVVGSTTIGDDAFVRKVNAADGTELWERRLDSTQPGRTSAEAIAGEGKAYVAGTVWGSLSDGIPNGDIDAFVRLYDTGGNTIWTRQYGTETNDTATGLAVHSSEVYVAGTTYGALPGETSAGSHDAYVRKYDAVSNVQWTRQFGSDQEEDNVRVASNSSGVYVTGRTAGTLPGQTSLGRRDAFIHKYDHSGNEVWTSQFGSSSWDTSTGVAADETGVYVIGVIESQRFVRRYDSAGNIVWTQSIEFPGLPYWSYYPLPTAVDAHSSGVYVAGIISVEWGDDRAFIVKLDSDGNVVWQSEFGLEQGTGANAVSVSESGVSIAGFYGRQQYGAIGHTFVRTYDFDGVELWTQQLPSEGWDYAKGVLSQAARVYVAGLVIEAVPGPAPSTEYEAYVTRLGTVDAPTAVLDLAGQVDEFDLPAGIENGLQAKLDTAFKKLDDANPNNDGAATNSLQAFINAVEAQSGKKIPEDDADALIAAAQAIIDILSDQ